jgi:tetratricopeptide repeat protein
MKKRNRRKNATNPREVAAQPEVPKKRQLWPIGLALAGLVSAIVAGLALRSTPAKRGDSPAYVPRPQGTVTFNKDIAPVILHNCAPCHRPGQSAPFTLLSYEEVRKKSALIAEVIEKRYMPPWLPEHGYGDFTGERRLTEDQIGVIKQWVAEGTAEGRTTDLPPAPKWPEGWELGEPDLVVALPSAYTLPPDGKDVYRNFLVPIPNTGRRYVRAVEFHPGNNKVVHHAFIEIDDTRQSRHLADSVSPPAFDGMSLPESVQMPGGQMLGWQPGKPPYVSPDGLSWVLEPNSDLVLQLHMQPSGKPETVQSAVGLYFTEKPPTNTPFRINLLRYTIDIPPGAKDYAIENKYVLPVDVHLLRILPHTHYLGKELQGYAILPDGIKKWLLLIRNWDFNWQGDYRYNEPVFLPKGTTLAMHFTYDNSADNPNNPNQPPKRVRYGLQTTDEMGELWFQVLARDGADREKLSRDFFVKLTQDSIQGNEFLLQTNPQDSEAHLKLGSALFAIGRPAQAITHLRAAIQFRPDSSEAHYQLGTVYLRQNRLDEARREFEAVVNLKPDDFQAHGSLGFIFLQQKNLEQAEFYLENALRINPNDPIARANLERVRKAKSASTGRN